jgi:hypothetical protein
MKLETASMVENRSEVEAVIARAPDHARAAINAVRVRRGLSPVLSIRDYQRLDQERRIAEAAAVEVERRRTVGTGVNDPRGSLVPAASQSNRRPAARAAASPTVPWRIVIVPCFGDAKSTNVGPNGEYIVPGAFGDARSLNATRGAWSIQWQHDGPTLAAAGSRLRAVDSEVGPVAVWDLDPQSPMAAEVVSAFARNGDKLAASVGMTIHDIRPSPLTRGAKWIARADLDHVAILPNASKQPLYKGAVALLRRRQSTDSATLRKHIDAAIAEARFRDRRAKGW